MRLPVVQIPRDATPENGLPFDYDDFRHGRRDYPQLLRAGELPVRIRLIHEQLLELIDAHRPDEMAVEGVFTARNARSALVLGHARGAELVERPTEVLSGGEAARVSLAGSSLSAPRSSVRIVTGRPRSARMTRR